MTTVVSKPGVSSSESTLLPIDLSGMDDISPGQRTSAGPYDVLLSTNARAEGPEQTFNLQVLDASEKEIQVGEGETATVKLVVNAEVFRQGAVYPLIFRRNLTINDKNFDSQSQTLARWDYSTEENADGSTGTVIFSKKPIPGLSFDKQLMETSVEISMTVDSFNKDIHSGYYCITVFTRLQYMMACSMLKGTEQEIPRRVNIETCSMHFDSTFSSSVTFNLGGPDCIKCIAAGFNNGQLLLLKRDSTGKSTVLETDDIYSNSPWVMMSSYYLSNASTLDDGSYTCIAIDQEEILRRTFEARALDPLVVETYGPLELVGSGRVSILAEVCTVSIHLSLSQITKKRNCTVNDIDAQMSFVHVGNDGVETPIFEGHYPCFDVIISDVTSFTEPRIAKGKEITVVNRKFKKDVPECTGEVNDEMEYARPAAIYCRGETEWQSRSSPMFDLEYDLVECCKRQQSDYNYNYGYY
ncbi:hypothetical protein CAPTEDRAFT_191935 [Capitella teleta]|uniref:Uncharacterized protein n=1 Tax=Capitella teleta TaxID=283909 RepID=R7VJN4_CAPTE|nr:hypothetical protein CAPTEDRAFT_191935 [Capitella teleta]|eukprot:ELU16631.1 hypothetical protein CAPTEDRAFT_191935 [Capitella teleta]